MLKGKKHGTVGTGGIESHDQRILELAAAGKTQLAIALELGIHRSAVWRRLKLLRGTLSQSNPKTPPSD
jgi:DNA invertase Pin-like site-specific DNA recombinase